MSEKKEKLDIRNMVKRWLKQHGYSALVYPGMGCGCGFDDFMPCDNPVVNGCVPGYEKIATKEDVENWEGDVELKVGQKFYVLKNPKERMNKK